MLYTILVLFAGLGFFIWYFLTYNTIVRNQHTVEQSWSQIEVELKRRFDLIGSLVEMVKGYSKYESATLQAIAAARLAVEGPTNPKDGAKVNREMGTLQKELTLLVEGYPTLKADERYAALQSELTNTENRIAEVRHRYNNVVNIYSNVLDTFPSSLIGYMHQFQRRQFFDAEPEADSAPQVVL